MVESVRALLLLSLLLSLLLLYCYSGADEEHQERHQSGAAATTSGNAEPASSASQHTGKSASSHGRGKGGRGLQARSQRADERGPGSSRGEGQGGDKEGGRGESSFCMCPGGQIVPTTTNPEELCINGMSFRYKSATAAVQHASSILHDASAWLSWLLLNSPPILKYHCCCML